MRRTFAIRKLWKMIILQIKKKAIYNLSFNWIGFEYYLFSFKLRKNYFVLKKSCKIPFFLNSQNSMFSA